MSSWNLGEVEKEEEVHKSLAFLPVLSSVVLPGPGVSGKVQD